MICQNEGGCMRKRSMKGKTVLITGGSKGIGRETARLFGRLGARVYICGRNREHLDRAEQALQQEGCSAASVQTDVRIPEACRELIEVIKKEEPGLDAVICNAGMSMRGSIGESTPEVFRTMTEINYLGAAYIAHYALPLLKSSQGSIVFISTIAALRGLPLLGPYGASKSSLQVLSESLRMETASDGVHVGLVHVGFTENDQDKLVYRSDGTLVPIARPKSSYTQEQAAEHIAACVFRRKRVMTLTALGRSASLVYRFFPRLADAMISRFTNKHRGMYQVRE